MSLDVTKPVIAIHGNYLGSHPARIICTDLVSSSPIAAIINLHGEEKVFQFRRGGWSSTSAFQLVNADPSAMRDGNEVSTHLEAADEGAKK